MNEFAARIHAAVPLTQCTRCGYPDREGYAQAIASGEAGINQCPPGGVQGIARLARITGNSLSVFSQDELDAIADSMNNRPRATHGFHAPLEVFARTLASAHQPSASIH